MSALLAILDAHVQEYIDEHDEKEQHQSDLTWDLLSDQTSYIKNTIGILPNILNTLYIILVAMVIVLPLGVGAAIYLTEYAENRKLVSLIEFAAETLTGIPSIIFGLVGMLFFVQKMNLQAEKVSISLILKLLKKQRIYRSESESTVDRQVLQKKSQNVRKIK